MAFTNRFLSMDISDMALAHSIFVLELGNLLEEHGIPKQRLADKLTKASSGLHENLAFEYVGVLAEVLESKSFDFRDFLSKPD